MRLMMVLVLISSLLHAQDETANVWTFGGDYFEEGREIFENENGGFSVVGTSGSIGGSTNLLFMNFDSDMNCVFTSVFGDSGVEKGYSICDASDGGWVLCGMTLNLGNGSYDVYVLHVSESGELMWSLKAGGDGWDFGYRIIRIGEGYAIAGSSYSYSDNGSDAIIMFISQTGELTNYWLYDTGADEEWIDIDLLEDGSILASGSITDDLGESAVFRMYDAEGSEDWTFIKSVTGYETRATGSAIGNEIIWYSAITRLEETDIACRGKLTLDGVEQSFIQQVQDGSYYFGQPIITDEFVVYPGNTTTYGAGGEDATIYMWNQSGPFVGAPTFGGILHETLYHGIETSSGEIFCTGSYTSFSDGMEQLAVVRLSAVYNGDYIKTFDYDNDCVSYLTVGELNIDSCGNPVLVEYMDLTGRILFSGNPAEISGAEMAQGMYLMKSTDESGCISVKTIFINSY